MTVDLAVMLNIAREAVHLGTRRLKTQAVQQVIAKGDRDMATDIDHTIEREILAFLAERTPGIDRFGEESGGNLATPHRWVLDPVDGTLNLVHGLPLYGVSLALTDGIRPLLGVISLPALDHTYWAAPGIGAWRDGNPIAPSTVNRLSEAMITIGDYGTGDDAPERNAVAIALHTALAPVAGKVRMLGSAAVDLALVADGTLDASITLGNRDWDMAAGVAIARAAGAAVTDTAGSPHDSRSLTTIATAPGLTGAILHILATATTGTRYASDRRAASC
ncbi:inositol monophosphatase family protein [Micromonospora narathiwatensis]|uniref:inositol-phosphate phosphatase n=1 Tax=Micromonospora narathiwatensis TaxID=299146 RepID=A0A1A8ZAB5_9ACTN|nr:inositol monophosphatase family protein [Micromonospora narathiwatensis]SBT40815.1 myo-inositol-1(or 4)-monophosphatase [Micromonospora narathiwatensis]